MNKKFYALDESIPEHERCIKEIKKIEIFVYFDPFDPNCWELERYMKKLSFEYDHIVRIRRVLLPSIKVLTKCQAQATETFDNIAFAMKAAELQGTKYGDLFIHHIFKNLNVEHKVLTTEKIKKCAQLAGLDIQEFEDDIRSNLMTPALKTDQQMALEMDVDSAPTVVFFGGCDTDEGIKVEGIYDYSVYTYIISNLFDYELEKKLAPSLLDYIKMHKIVSEKDIMTLYDWDKQITARELKKLNLQKHVTYFVGRDQLTYWKLNNV